VDKLSEAQFISILDNVILRHNELRLKKPTVRTGSMDSFDWMSQTFCQILWKHTAPQNDYLKTYLVNSIGVIIGNRAYTPRSVVVETLSLSQFSKLFTALLSAYGSHSDHRCLDANEVTVLNNSASFLSEVLKEHLDNEYVKINLNIDFGNRKL
jgi:hypothetical protein